MNEIELTGLGTAITTLAGIVWKVFRSHKDINKLGGKVDTQVARLTIDVAAHDKQIRDIELRQATDQAEHKAMDSKLDKVDGKLDIMSRQLGDAAEAVARIGGILDK